MNSEGRVDDKDYSSRKLQTSLSLKRDTIQLLGYYSIFIDSINMLNTNIRKKVT